MASKNRKMFLGIFFIVLVLGIYFFTPVKLYFSRENLNALKEMVENQGVWAPLVFIGLYIGATILFLPGTILTLLAGLIFGIWEGTLHVVIGANVGALAAFLIARYLGRSAVEGFLRRDPRIGRLDERIRTGGFMVVLWLRLVPLFPYNLLNYALGLTHVRLKDYLSANLLGMFPAIFVYVSLGNAASQFSLIDPAVWKKIEVWGPFVLVILLSFLPKIIRKWRKDAQKI